MTRLHCERLEERSVPALFGRPWADHAPTISFVPDDTPVDGRASDLFKTMNQVNGMAQPAWQTEILRAAQKWADAAHLNVGLVSDSGASIGISGKFQGDSRFGDIRVSARPLSNDVLAVTIPPGVIGGTRTGDIVINSAKPFAIGNVSGKYDLFTVMLQEMGHAFGIGNSINPLSPMFEQYMGVRTGLTTVDVANIQDLYHVRPGDPYEGAAGNGTAMTASKIDLPVIFNVGQSRAVLLKADLSSANDVDYYKFSVPLNVIGLAGVKVRPTGQSLLTPRVSVYPFGQAIPIITGAVTSPLLSTDTSVTFGPVLGGQEYVLKVEKAPQSDFTIGAYGLQLSFDLSLPDLPLVGPLVFVPDPTGGNNTAGLATVLPSDPNFRANRVFHINSGINVVGDVDYYKITGPAEMNGVTALTVVVRATSGTAVPEVVIGNATGLPIGHARVLSNGNGEFVAQIPVINPSSTYTVSIKAPASNPNFTGDYEFICDFYAPIISLTPYASGSLSTAKSDDVNHFYIPFGSVIHFTLNATGGVPQTESGVRSTVYDNVGRPVADLFAKTGQTRSTQTFLRPGHYAVHTVGLTRFPAALPNMTFGFQGMLLSDPIGVTAAVDDTVDQLDDTPVKKEGIDDPVFEDPIGDPEW